MAESAFSRQLAHLRADDSRSWTEHFDGARVHRVRRVEREERDGAATSSGFIAGAKPLPFSISVSTEPGITHIAWSPVPRSSSASDLMKPTVPHFAAQYALWRARAHGRGDAPDGHEAPAAEVAHAWQECARDEERPLQVHVEDLVPLSFRSSSRRARGGRCPRWRRRCRGRRDRRRRARRPARPRRRSRRRTAPRPRYDRARRRPRRRRRASRSFCPRSARSHPRLASSTAIARPIPRPAPVTTAITGRLRAPRELVRPRRRCAPRSATVSTRVPIARSPRATMQPWTSTSRHPTHSGSSTAAMSDTTPSPMRSWSVRRRA